MELKVEIEEEAGSGSNHLSNATKILGEVVKPLADKREYRALELVNGMTVLVISDPETKKAAAALNVLSGSLNDPIELPGLAHFLQHLLFTGSEKYKVEHEYRKFIYTSDGTCNATTTGDTTSFYFTCSPEDLEGAVDRFAQYFISPLLSEKCYERQKKAVISKHEADIDHDGSRSYRVHSFLTNKSHPYSHFTTGNQHTIENLFSGNGIDVKSELLNFYKANYSANIMKLVVLGKESCDDLQSMVEEYFNDVPNSEMEIPQWDDSPFGPEEYQTRINILPASDMRELCLVFPLPDLRMNYYRSGTMWYLVSLIVHEGPGSILSLLRRKNWATYVNQLYEIPGRGFSFLFITVGITELGLKFVEDVVKIIFQYLKMLRNKGPQQWYWKELQLMKETDFKYSISPPPHALVKKFAEQMAGYPPEEVWTSQFLMSDFQPNLITDTLNALVPDKVRIVIETMDYKDIVTETEEYFGTKYLYEKIPDKVIQEWKNCEINPELEFPPRNLFIPSEFELKPRDKVTGIIPKIVVDDELSRVWFLQDNEFLLPHAFIVVDILNPCPKKSSRNYVLQSLLVKIAEDTLAEHCYQAGEAGLSYSISGSSAGVRVEVNGYNHKLPQLLDKILEHLVNMNSVGDHFEKLKAAYVNELEEWKEEEPLSHASNYVNQLLTSFTFTNDDLLSAADELTPENVLAYVEDMLSCAKLQWLICGNMTRETALVIHSQGVQHFHKFGTRAITATDLLPNKEIHIPCGCSFLYTADLSTSPNSCVRIIMQLDMETVRRLALISIVNLILEKPCSRIVRPKKNLGHYSACEIRKSNGVLAFEIYAQGSQHPEVLETLVEDCLTEMWTEIKQLTKEAFERYKNSYKKLLKEKLSSLGSRVRFIDCEIRKRKYDFDMKNVMLKELDEIKLEELQRYYQAWIMPGSPNRRKLSIHVVSTAEGGAGHKKSLSSECKRTKLHYVIEDPKEWRSQLRSYPYPYPVGQFPPWKVAPSSETPASSI